MAGFNDQLTKPLTVVKATSHRTKSIRVVVCDDTACGGSNDDNKNATLIGGVFLSS